MMSAMTAVHIPSGPSSASVCWTTKMMNVLTLLLVTLPGLTLSFPNNGYVCCNQPATSPKPYRSLKLLLAKRDDRDAVYRALGDASGRDADNSGADLLDILGMRHPNEGGYPKTETAPRDSLLASILGLLRSSDKHRDSRYIGYDGSAALQSKRKRGVRKAQTDQGK